MERIPLDTSGFLAEKINLCTGLVEVTYNGEETSKVQEIVEQRQSKDSDSREVNRLKSGASPAVMVKPTWVPD